MSDSVVLAPRVLAVASHVSCLHEFHNEAFWDASFHELELIVLLSQVVSGYDLDLKSKRENASL